MNKTDEKKTLLLVEDELLVAMIKQKELEEYGYNVLIINTGEKAVSLIRGNDSIDLILMDIQLGPGIDGIEAAVQILKEHDIPIIFLSSHSEPEIVAKTEKISSYGYVEKETNITVLDSSIKMAFKLFKAYQEVKINKERLSTLIDTIPFVTGLAKSDGTLIVVNDTMGKSLGCPKEELFGKSMFDFFLPEVKEIRTKKIAEVVESGKPLQWEDERDGRSFNNSVYPVIDNNGTVKEVALFAIETTERKKTEDKIKIQQKMNELLLNSMPYPIMLINKKRIVKAANKVALDVGVKIGDYCWKEFGRCECLSDENKRRSINNPEDPGIQCTFCMMDKIFKNNKPANDPAVEAFGRIWDTFWIPLNEDEYLHYAIDITERKQAEDKIKMLLGEKEVLLKEVHHRVKNNMSVIRNLLSMHIKSMHIKEINNSEVVKVFQDAIGRIECMGVLYDKLYKQENYMEVSIKDYLSQLINEIVEMFPGNKIKVEKQIDNFTIRTKIVFSLGIIMNELITNAMKYAFTDRENGLIKISLKKENEHINVIFEDNGIGMSMQEYNKGKGFGLKLIDLLVKQIEGSLRIENSNGTKYFIMFKA